MRKLNNSTSYIPYSSVHHIKYDTISNKKNVNSIGRSQLVNLTNLYFNILLF